MSNSAPTPSDPYYSVETVAKLFDVKPYTVRGWINEGRMSAVKIMGRWKIKQSEVKRVANEEHE